jgi:dsRNA-specific ribonuclease
MTMLSVEAQVIAMNTIDTQISRLEDIVGYVSTNKLWNAEALQMREPIAHLCIGGIGYYVAHNEHLEQSGDRILDVVLAEAWYKARGQHGTANRVYLLNTVLTQRGRLPTLQEYQDMQLDLVTNKRLSERGHRLRLDKCVVRAGGTRSICKAQIANAFEAVIGAVYKDSDGNALVVVRAMLERLGFFEHPTISVMSCSPPPILL